MTALTFALKKTPAFQVNCSQLTPDKLAGKTTKQILEITLNNSIKVIDLFEVTGENFEQIIFKNSSSQLDFIGHKMSFGSIVCQGDVGDRAGDQMRRGLILIDGDAGEYCGSRMLAGTIGVHGKVAKYVGFAMKRGTILLNNKTDFHATIQDCGTHNLPFLALLFQSFKALPSKFNSLKNQRAQRFAGDLACNSNGEILVISD